MAATQEQNAVQSPVYLIYSQWSLSAISEFLLGFGSKDEIGPLRVDRSKGQETDRTICLLSNNLYQRLITAGHNKRSFNSDFSIVPYSLRERSYPKEGESRNLYIPLLHNLSTDDCRTQIEEKMTQIVYFGLIMKNKYKLTIRLKTRESTEHDGHSFIMFDPTVTLENIALIRVVLHDTYWHNPKTQEFILSKCFWAREQKKQDFSDQKLPEDNTNFNHVHVQGNSNWKKGSNLGVSSNLSTPVSVSVSKLDALSQESIAAVVKEGIAVCKGAPCSVAK